MDDDVSEGEEVEEEQEDEGSEDDSEEDEEMDGEEDEDQDDYDISQFMKKDLTKGQSEDGNNDAFQSFEDAIKVMTQGHQSEDVSKGKAICDQLGLLFSLLKLLFG